MPADELESFRTELMQEVIARATASNENTRTAFVEECAGRLMEAEVLQDWAPAFFEGRGYRGRNLEVDAYSTDEVELDGTLQVLIADLRPGTQVETLSAIEVKSLSNRAEGFVIDAYEGRLHAQLEPSTPAADLARTIWSEKGRLRTIRVLVLSNASMGVRKPEAERTSSLGLKVEVHVYDLRRFSLLAESGGREELELDVTKFVREGLPALPAGIGETDYGAYLCVVPGAFLADIYDEYGGRLLEGNVRAFLSTRGNVNKGLRATLLNHPEKFFAFNNGITATASEVETKDGRITKLRSLQIVNGGQTTASIFNVRARDKAPLDGVYVQMKLSVLPAELAQTMVPEISRYANTQNKVSDADLFANHPFHLRVERLSRQVWAPPRAGGQQTHWYYERARAQYQTDQYRLSPSEKKAFLLINPKDQLIRKTDLAKFENTWRCEPHVVSLGAQKNFVRYADVVREEFDASPDDFNDRWFQHLVSKAVLFNTAEDVVSNAPWYGKGYRANIVTYGVALLVHALKSAFPGFVLDLDQIWRAQKLSDTVIEQLKVTTRAAFGILIQPPGETSNVTEWAKKERCWREVSQLNVTIVPGIERYIKPKEAERVEQRDARGQAREDAVIDAAMDVLRRGRSGFWNRAISWPDTRKLLSAVELGLLQTAASRGANWAPTDRQAKRLIEAARRLESEGLE